MDARASLGVAADALGQLPTRMARQKLARSACSFVATSGACQRFDAQNRRFWTERGTPKATGVIVERSERRRRIVLDQAARSIERNDFFAKLAADRARCRVRRALDQFGGCARSWARFRLVRALIWWWRLGTRRAHRVRNRCGCRDRKLARRVGIRALHQPHPCDRHRRADQCTEADPLERDPFGSGTGGAALTGGERRGAERATCAERGLQ